MPEKNLHTIEDAEELASPRKEKASGDFNTLQKGSDNVSTPSILEVPIETKLVVNLKSGTSFEGILIEKKDDQITLRSSVGTGLKISLKEEEIETWSLAQGEKQDGRTQGLLTQSEELTGSITHFDGNLGWITGDNGEIYRFAVNDAKKDVQRFLKNSYWEGDSVSVGFTPGIYTNRLGDSSIVARKIRFLQRRKYVNSSANSIRPIRISSEESSDTLISDEEVELAAGELFGKIVTISFSKLSGQVSSPGRTRYRFNRKSIDDQLLANLALSSNEQISAIAVIFRLRNGQPQGNKSVAYVRMANPIPVNPLSALDSAFSLFEKHQFARAEVLIDYAMRNGQNDKAIEGTEELVRFHAENKRPSSDEGRVLKHLGKYADSFSDGVLTTYLNYFKQCAEACKSRREQLTLLNIISNVAFRNRRYGDAIATCNQAEVLYTDMDQLEISNKERHTLFKLKERKILCLANLNDLGQAKDIAEDLLEKLPDSQVVKDLFLQLPRPSISCRELIPSYWIKDDVIRTHLVLANAANCQDASSIDIAIAQKGETHNVRIEKNYDHAVNLHGGDEIEIMLDLNIGSDYKKTASLSLPLACTYNFRAYPSLVPTRQTDMWEIPLTIAEEKFAPLRNPYSAYVGGNPITDENDAMFYGRKAEKQQMLNLVQNSGHMNYGVGIAMYGQTRTGKSSLLGQAKNAIIRCYEDSVLLCDMGNIGEIQSDENNKDRYLAEFLYRLLSECCDSLAANERFANEVNPDDFEPPFEMIENPSHAAPLFHRYMKRLDRFLKSKGAIILLTIDEFTYLHSLINNGLVSENFMRLWKAILQDYCVFAIVVGQDDMPEFMHEHPNEFACMETLKLTYLDEASSKALIHEPLERENNRANLFRQEAINGIHEATAGSAFLTMKICSKLVDFLNEIQGRIVTKGILEAFMRTKAFGPVGFLEEKDFEPQLTERGHSEYNDATRKLLHDIALKMMDGIIPSRAQIQCQGVSEEEIDELLERLVNRNVLVRLDGKYRIQVLLLAQWLVQTMGTEVSS